MKKNASKNAAPLPVPTIIKGKNGVSLAGPAQVQGTLPAPAAPIAPPAAPPAPTASATAQGTATATVNRNVLLTLPIKGTERFINPNSGIEWIKHTPSDGSMANWYQMAPKGTAETGIHSAVKNADGSWTLTIDRARLPHRKRGQMTHGTITEIEPVKTA